MSDKQLKILRAKYYDLLYAVGNKYEGESRHETAKRYIKQAEMNQGGPCENKTPSTNKGEHLKEISRKGLASLKQEREEKGNFIDRALSKPKLDT